MDTTATNGEHGPPLNRHIAHYRKQVVPQAQGNPFIEALPDMMSKSDFYKKLYRQPMIDEKTRDFDDNDRIFALSDLKRLYIPTGVHEQIYRRIANMIRYGYTSRNPCRETSYWQNAAKRAEMLNVDADGSDELESSASALTILGISGIGKTTLLRRLRHLYGDYIDHSGEYNGQRFGSYRQIPWVSLHVPERGSIKGLILSFFKQVDTIAGTSHYTNHARNGRNSAETMMPSVATVVAEHGIGLMSLDELHNLNAAANGGDVGMINLLVRLIETANLPILMIGSYACLDFLTKEFRILRRSMSDGAIMWDRMVYDEIWKYFAETMWRFQVLRRPTDFTEKFAAILYDECQGITAYAIDIFKMAQIIAIEDGTERITPDTLRQAAQRQVNEVIEVIHALRTNNRKALEKMGDVFPSNLAERLQPGCAYSSGGVPTPTKPNHRNVTAQPDPSLLSDEADLVSEWKMESSSSVRVASRVMDVLAADDTDDPDKYLTALRHKGLVADLSKCYSAST